jgi:hypothetical protein
VTRGLTPEATRGSIPEATRAWIPAPTRGPTRGRRPDLTPGTPEIPVIPVIPGRIRGLVPDPGARRRPPRYPLRRAGGAPGDVTGYLSLSSPNS